MKNEENTNAGFIARRIEAEADPEAVLLTKEAYGELCYLASKYNEIITEGEIIIQQKAAEAFCDHYCRFPREYDEEAHGVPLAESHICKNCPLSLAEIGGSV